MWTVYASPDGLYSSSESLSHHSTQQQSSRKLSLVMRTSPSFVAGCPLFLADIIRIGVGRNHTYRYLCRHMLKMGRRLIHTWGSNLHQLLHKLKARPSELHTVRFLYEVRDMVLYSFRNYFDPDLVVTKVPLTFLLVCQTMENQIHYHWYLHLAPVSSLLWQGRLSPDFLHLRLHALFFVIQYALAPDLNNDLHGIGHRLLFWKIA